MSTKLQLFAGLWLTGVVVAAKPAWAIPSVSEMELPANTVKELVSQTATSQALIIVNEVQANPTEKGVEIILQTTVGEQLQISDRSGDNNYIADIPNAQLRLPSGDKCNQYPL